MLKWQNIEIGIAIMDEVINKTKSEFLNKG
jgi:hypothetical protein